jgi:hypothetical protein
MVSVIMTQFTSVSLSSLHQPCFSMYDTGTHLVVPDSRVTRSNVHMMNVPYNVWVSISIFLWEIRRMFSFVVLVDRCHLLVSLTVVTLLCYCQLLSWCIPHTESLMMCYTYWISLINRCVVVFCISYTLSVTYFSFNLDSRLFYFIFLFFSTKCRKQLCEERRENQRLWKFRDALMKIRIFGGKFI